MFGVNWNDPQTLWLNVTNLALGVVILAAVLIVVGAVGRELAFKHRRMRPTADIDAELRSILDVASPHILEVPGLGLTMADGGTPVKPAAESNGPKATRK
jgi:hypothetical protein